MIDIGAFAGQIFVIVLLLVLELLDVELPVPTRVVLIEELMQVFAVPCHCLLNADTQSPVGVVQTFCCSEAGSSAN